MAAGGHFSMWVFLRPVAPLLMAGDEGRSAARLGMMRSATMAEVDGKGKRSSESYRNLTAEGRRSCGVWAVMRAGWRRQGGLRQSGCSRAGEKDDRGRRGFFFYSMDRWLSIFECRGGSGVKLLLQGDKGLARCVL